MIKDWFMKASIFWNFSLNRYLSTYPSKRFEKSQKSTRKDTTKETTLNFLLYFKQKVPLQILVYDIFN